MDTLEPFDITSDAGRARLLQLHRRAQVGGCVSGIAHDINNLLGAAMAYAELVSYDEGISPDSAKMLNQVVDGISKCSRLVSTLTSISRRDRLDVSLASPEQLVDEVIVLRDYEFKLKRVAVERIVAADLPTISVDMAKLKLALVFLLVNAQEALESTDDKKVRITLDHEDGNVRFHVWDSGPGLSPEGVEEAFTPFQTSWPDGDHMGLGLYSARKIAELHGGDLTYTLEGGFCLRIKRDSGLQDQPT